MDIITGAYESFEDARNVALRLEEAGIAPARISLVGRQQTGDDDTARGAAAGSLIGATTGLLAGLGVVAVPGIGPVVAMGWIASAFVGAGAGGLTGGVIGTLAQAGLFQRDAEVYAASLEQGASLVSVQAEEAEAPRVRAILEAGMPIRPPGRPPDGDTGRRTEDPDLSGVVS